jgi:HSP20 family protein
MAMTDVMKRNEDRPARPELFDRFDRVFSDWITSLPFRRTTDLWDGERTEMIRVEEFEEDGHIVVRAEVPGVDPESDIDVSVVGGALRIAAERKQEEKTEGRGYVRNELRYGKFTRTVPLPEGTTAADIAATYTNGILEVRVPVAASAPATKVPVTRT